MDSHEFSKRIYHPHYFQKIIIFVRDYFILINSCFIVEFIHFPVRYRSSAGRRHAVGHRAQSIDTFFLPSSRFLHFSHWPARDGGPCGSPWWPCFFCLASFTATAIDEDFARDSSSSGVSFPTFNFCFYFNLPLCHS